MNVPSQTAPPATGRLVRLITLPTAVLLVVSNVVGSGIFKKIAPMAAELHAPGWVLLCWLAAGLLSLAGTLSNAEIAGMMADSGGEYSYYRRVYGNFFAYLFGWSSFAVIRTAALGSLAFVFAQSVNRLVPLGGSPAGWQSLTVLGLHPLADLPVKAVAIGLLLGLTYYNSRGLKLGALLSNVLTIGMIGAIIIIITAGLLSPVGSWANLTTPSATRPALHGSDLLSAFALAALSAFWAYEGWASLGYIGGEIKNPQRNLPLALVFGSLIVIGLYVGLNGAYLYILPVDELIRIQQSPGTIAAVAVVERFAGPVGAVAIAGLITLATFNCTSSSILTAARITYALANNGQFFRPVARINPTTDTPNVALWVQGLWASVLVLSGTFDQLTDMVIFAAFLFYGATTLAVFILRRRQPDAPRPYRVWGYPLVPGVFLAFCALLVVNTIVSKPGEALTGLGLMSLGVPLYAYFRRQAARAGTPRA